LVGGTGLYIDSLIYDFSLSKLPSNTKLRSELDLLSNAALFEKLEQIDPEYARELHPNNRPYIERAIEVKLLTGKSKRDFRREKILLYDTLFLTPYDDNRPVLYARIEQRIDAMLEMGLLDEIKFLLKKYKESDFGMDTIGYREFFPYFRGEISLCDAIKQVKQNTRNYAKRQGTWFSKYRENQ
jgi:tRNA dimethylallyltransferase